MENLMRQMTGGNNANRKGLAIVVGAVVVAVVVAVVAYLLCINNGFRSVTDYDCDVRTGCNTRNLTQRETTNILLDKAQRMEAGREGFDLSDYQPGVCRPYISDLMVDRKIRSGALDEHMTGRNYSDFVNKQFGNEGTVINYAVNPMMRPARYIYGVPPSS